MSAAERARRKLAQAGFQKLRDRKYLAPVAGVSGEGKLEIPDVPYGIFDADEGYHVERARVANADDETLGMYSGVLTDTRSTTDIEWGVNVPPYQELVNETQRLLGSDVHGNYAVEEDEEEPSYVVVTFADDRQLTMRSMGYEPVTQGDGVTVWRDILDQ